MSLAQIEYFVAVAEEGHMGRAARTLRIAQPAVSRQIKRLEDELGADLFQRTPRGMILSDEGQVFLQHARAVLRELRVARDAVRKGPSRSGAT
jgi:DNA-binding transcriptional LysR family regulator